ncbi:hypothetical protein Tco_0620269 [Tanacetum coccineum]
MNSETWNQDLSPTGKLLQPFGQGLMWFVANEKELWDSRKHRTGKEAGEEEMPKVLDLRRLKQEKMKKGSKSSPTFRGSLGKEQKRSTPMILFDLRTWRPPTFD